MLATLLLSFGVPMLLGGDEMSRTQQGNNNAYCQDNEITWLDWTARAEDTGLPDFTRRLIALRKAHPVFRRNRFLAGADAADLRWFTPAGTGMTDAGWSDQSSLAVALYLDGYDAPDQSPDGTWLTDNDFLVLVSAWWEPLEFTLPATRPEAEWQLMLDTYDLAPQAGPGAGRRKTGDQITVGPRSVVVLMNPCKEAHGPGANQVSL
jgi:glycogen operon protein